MFIKILKYAIPLIFCIPLAQATTYLTPSQLDMNRQMTRLNTAENGGTKDMEFWKDFSSITDLNPNVLHWGPEDNFTMCWMPQGITIDEERNFLYASWHNDPDYRDKLSGSEEFTCDIAQKGVRLSIIDLETLAYRNVLLLKSDGDKLLKGNKPLNGEPDNRRSYHAGGLALKGTELHVANTDVVYIFELDKLEDMLAPSTENSLKLRVLVDTNRDSSIRENFQQFIDTDATNLDELTFEELRELLLNMHNPFYDDGDVLYDNASINESLLSATAGYRYVLKQKNYYNLPSLASFISYNSGDDTFLSGHFNKTSIAENNTLVRFNATDINLDEHIVSNLVPVDNFPIQMQGAVEKDGLIWTSSAWDYAPARLTVTEHDLTIPPSAQTKFENLLLPPGTEDLTLDATGKIWTLTEFSHIQYFAVCLNYFDLDSTVLEGKCSGKNNPLDHTRFILSLDSQKVVPEKIAKEKTRLDVASAANFNGDTVTVWREYSSLLNNYVHKASTFNVNTGLEYKTDLQITDYAQGGTGINPASVAIDDQGNFFVTWQDDTDNDGYYDVKAAGYDLQGELILPAFTVNEYLSGNSINPAIAIKPNTDELFFVWQDDNDNNAYYNIHLRSVTKSGQPVIAQTLVNSTTKGQQRRPQLAMNDNTLVVTWEDDSDNNDYYNVYAKIYNITDLVGLTVLKNEFKVNPVSKGHQYRPDVSINSNNSIAFVWQDDKDENGYYNIYTRSLAVSSGSYDTNNATTFRANTEASGQQYTPKVIINNQDHIFTSWSDDKDKNGYYEVMVSVRDMQGNSLTDDIIVNTLNNGQQKRASITIPNRYSDQFYIFWQDDPTIRIASQEVHLVSQKILGKGLDVVNGEITTIVPDKKVH